MNIQLGKIVLVADAGLVCYGVVTKKTTTLVKGEERENYVVLWENPYKCKEPQEEEVTEADICEVGAWNDSSRVIFLREKGNSKWAEALSEKMLNPEEVIEPAPALPVAVPVTSPDTLATTIPF